MLMDATGWFDLESLFAADDAHGIFAIDLMQVILALTH